MHDHYVIVNHDEQKYYALDDKGSYSSGYPYAASTFAQAKLFTDLDQVTSALHENLTIEYVFNNDPSGWNVNQVVLQQVSVPGD